MELINIFVELKFKKFYPSHMSEKSMQAKSEIVSLEQFEV